GSLCYFTALATSSASPHRSSGIPSCSFLARAAAASGGSGARSQIGSVDEARRRDIDPNSACREFSRHRTPHPSKARLACGYIGSECERVWAKFVGGSVKSRLIPPGYCDSCAFGNE